MDFIKKLAVIVSFLCIGLALLDSIRNPEFVRHLIGFSGGQILFGVFVVLAIFRIFQTVLLSKKLTVPLIFIGTSFLTLGCLLAIVGFFGRPNFVYSRTFINVDKVFLLGVFMLSVGFLEQGRAFYKLFLRPIIFLLPIIFLILLLFYGLLPGFRLQQLVKENDFIENIQFLVLLVSSFFSAKISLSKFGKNKIHSIVFLGLALVLFFIAVDEIAWGQDVFRLATPDSISAINTQKEITIHNTRSIEGYVPYLYILMGLYGSFAWLFVKEKLFAPASFLFLYFFLPAYYNIVSFFHIPGIGVFSEPAELLLYAGIMFHLLLNLEGKKLFNEKT